MTNYMQLIEEGSMTFVEAFAAISNEIKKLEAIKDEIYKDATEEAREFNKDEPYFGFIWSIRTGKTTYDFEADKEYCSINEALKSRRKALTEATKALANNKTFFDNDSGEELPHVPVKSVAKDVLTFAIAKKDKSL